MQIMDYLFDIILIGISIALKKKVLHAGEFFERKWWIFLVFGILRLILHFSLFLQKL